MAASRLSRCGIRPKACRTIGLCGIVLAGLLLSEAVAIADERKAEVLFQEGRSLMKAGRWEAACAVLASSYELEAAPGTLLNLALCHENEGKLARSYQEYKELVDRSRREGRPDRVSAAEERLRELEPTLSRLTVSIATPSAEDALMIEVDGALLPRTGWNERRPIERGRHTVVARTEGRERFREEIEIDRPGDTRVSVRLAEPTPIVAAPALFEKKGPPEEAPPRTSERRIPIASWVLGGTGVAAAVIGVVFTASGLSIRRRLTADGCSPTCPHEDVDHARQAFFAADLSGAVSILAVAGGVLAFVLQPRPHPATAARISAALAVERSSFR
jgi:hypothetical protein